MITSNVNPFESRDRKIQSLHDSVTRIHNTIATAVVAEDWDKLTALQVEEENVTNALDRAMKA